MEKKNLQSLTIFSSILIIAVVAAVFVISSSNEDKVETSTASGHLSTSSKSIKAVCEPTDYKETCETALKAAGDNTTDFHELVKVAFKVTIDSIKKVFDQKSFAEDAAKDKRTADALDVCRELLDHAVNDISQSLDRADELNTQTINKAVDDLKVWLGAAIAHQEVCLDAFKNTTTDTGAKMRKAMKTGQELTSNVLAIVSEIGDLLGGFDLEAMFGGQSKRRLSSSGEPIWMTSTHKRLLQLTPAQLKPKVTVAKDGSGDVKTITEALAKVPKMGTSLFVIYIKKGVYAEQVHVNRLMTNVMLVGDGPNKTRIVGNLNFADGVPVFRTAVVAAAGDGFIAKDLGIENMAGATKEEAVALRVQSDMAVIYNCQIDGNQDTLFAHTRRQFYRDCTISGTKDFIFGTAPVVFQNCNILVRKPAPNDKNVVTAQGRTDRRDPGATVFQNCTITADPNFAATASKSKNYLGRPLKPFSRVLFIQSFIDSLIHPDGWVPFMNQVGLDTCFYAEVDNKGPGSDKSKRVKWPGVKLDLTLEKVDKFTVKRFLKGDQWLPRTGVPFVADFSVAGVVA